MAGGAGASFCRMARRVWNTASRNVCWDEVSAGVGRDTDVMDADVLDLAKKFLAPYSKKLLLNTTQAINISPGEGAQDLHRDRFAWVDFARLSIGMVRSSFMTEKAKS